MLGSAANPLCAVPTARNPQSWAQNQGWGNSPGKDPSAVPWVAFGAEGWGNPSGKGSSAVPWVALGTEMQQCWGQGQVPG